MNIMNSKAPILPWLQQAWIQIITTKTSAQKKSPVEFHRAS